MIGKLEIQYSTHAIQRMWERKIDPFHQPALEIAEGHVLHEIRLACPGHWEQVKRESPFVYWHKRRPPKSARQRDIYVTTFEAKAVLKIITVFTIDIFEPNALNHATLQENTRPTA